LAERGLPKIMLNQKQGGKEDRYGKAPEKMER
jgi:hypothetical protein